MTEKSEPSRIEDQINQLHSNLDKVGSALTDLSATASTACIPEELCEVAAIPNSEFSGVSPLVNSLHIINERILSLAQRIININERLEL